MLRASPACLAAAASIAALAATTLGRAEAAGLADLDLPGLFDTLADTSRHVADLLGAWAADSYARRPVLMAGLVGVALVPVLVVAGVILRRLAPAPRRSRVRPATEALPRAAWLEIGTDGRSPPRFTVPIARELVQIGRQDDNDICIEDDTVHRYHAVIECSRDIGYIITDVSGPHGNGVRVNGERLIKSSLTHGDIVELGHARFKFATAA